MPLTTVVLSNVHAAGEVADIARTTLFSRNSTRSNGPVTAAWNVVSPVTLPVPFRRVMAICGPLAAPAGFASKSSTVIAPDAPACRPTPALPAPVMLASRAWMAKSGLSLHEPSGVSHCRVSVR